MKKTEIAKLRLRNQRIAHKGFSRASEVVSWLGAVQAQDYNMAKWALGLRMSSATSASIEDEIDSGSIVRTHVMRPTWHFVPAADVRWLLDLTAPRIESAARSRQRVLELDAKTLNRTTKIIARALEGEVHLTRQELMAVIARKGILTNPQRGIHIMFKAELDGVVCNGKRRGKQFTYALMDERVPQSAPLPKDVACARLATRYFTSHGPATIRDFIWWSGLSPADAREGLNLVRSNLVSDEVEGHTYWWNPAETGPTRKSVHLLPAFDEFTVSYCDRTASVRPELMKDVTVGHAIFRPIVVVDGRVVGIWIRKFGKNGPEIDYTFFEDLTRSQHAMLLRAEKQYRAFETPLER
ncbi:MAG: winged helix DNA-binding domain-containing protein [Acidobacteriota bacterium]